MTEQQWFVGIDLGGTAIKLAFVTMDGVIAYKTFQKTHVTNGGDYILEQMNTMINQGLEALQSTKAHIIGIGIGAPAFLDTETGFVHEAVNLNWKNYPLKQKLQEITELPVYVENDANTAALGEMWKGAGEGTKHLLCITLGTGLGAGIIINGDIYNGARGSAGELGHVTVQFDNGYLCNCGKKGCIETIASATGIVRMVEEDLKNGTHPQIKNSVLDDLFYKNGSIRALDVAIAAQEGDGYAQDVFNRLGFYLGAVLGNYAITMNPEKIVIGGGVSKAGSVLFEPIKKYYRQFALPHLTGDIDIVAAQLENDAGVIGAAWLVKNNSL